jgi:hypothetical protein
LSAKKIYDLAVVVGQYVDQAGQQKNRYQTVGAVMQTDTGSKFLLLERWFNPGGVPYDSTKGNSVLVSMFDPNRQGQGQGGNRSGGSGQGQQADDSDIPF